MLSPEFALTLILSAVVFAADGYARRVPNIVVLAGLVLGAGLLLWHAWYPEGSAVVSARAGLLGLLAGLVGLLPFYAFGWMGAGDVKFFAVLGLLLGWQALLPVWIVGSLLAGAHAALILGWRYVQRHQPAIALAQLRWEDTNMHKHLIRCRHGRHGLPYAAYLALGAAAYVAMQTLPHGVVR